jgi:dihydrofolate reductase
LIVTLIAAMAENRVIGRQGRLPWHLPEDLARFRRLTMGHPLIMGRKTFEAIARPLPGRTTIVLSRQPGYRAHGCAVCGSLDEALEAAAATGAPEVFICGGSDIYRQALHLAQFIQLTLVPGHYEGDVIFPPIPPDFEEVAREEGEGEPSLAFITYKRRHPGIPTTG